MRAAAKNRGKCQSNIEIDKEYQDIFQVDDVADGDESLSVMAWKGQIAEPLNHPPIVKQKPNVVYELDFAFGVETTDN